MGSTIMTLSKSNRPTYQIVVFIFLAAIILKIPYITNPISDWHSWNQISTMAVAKHIAFDEPRSLFPTKSDIFESFKPDSNISYAEFPVLSGIIALAFSALGGVVEWPARLICIVFSAIGTVYFYKLVLEETDEKTSKIAVFIYLISPMVWYFHRTVMTDVVMVSFVIAGLYHFRWWLKEYKISSFIFATFFTAVAALAKAYALYIGIAYLLMLIDHKGWKKLICPSNIIFAIGTLAPITVWLAYCQLQIGAGSAGRNLTVSNELIGPVSIWFRYTYWSSLLASVGDFTLTPINFLVFLYAWFNFKLLKNCRISLYWLASVMFYFLFIRQGNMEHDYYQMPFSAPVILITAIGWKNLITNYKDRIPKRYFNIVGAVIVILLVLNASKYVHTKAKLNMSPVVLGQKLAELNLDKDRVLIVDSENLQRNQAVFYSTALGWHTRGIPNIEDINQYYQNGVRWVGLNLSQDELASTSETRRDYDQKFSQVWANKSTNRYQKIKTLIIYRL